MSEHTRSLPVETVRRAILVMAVMTAVCGTVLAGGGAGGPLSIIAQDARGSHQKQDAGFPPPNEPWNSGSIELALSNDSFWAAYRSPMRRGLGHGELGVLTNSDHDWLVNGRLMRYGEPGNAFPLSWGVGIGVYAAFLDEPDAEAYALALTALARHRLPTITLATVVTELSYAPDITTFDDGEGLFDFVMRVETEVNEYAMAFVGYRHLEIDLEHGSDHEVDDRLHFGIRLSF